jgi:SWI/SNF-related matrix-associated actin-dependent regulator 1 of chromatin subfamily A
VTKLLAYQSQGVRMAIDTFHGRFLNADEMGLGKTIQSLAVMREMETIFNLAVAPAGLKRHWAKEAYQHFNKKSYILYGETPSRSEKLGARAAIECGELLINNYDILHAWLPFLLSLHIKTLVGDECHVLGNLKSQRGVNFRILARGVPYIHLLSGTPLVNRPWELFPSLHILCPADFSSPFSFGFRYCEAKKSWGKWVFNGARRLPELHKRLLRTCMIRRTKEEVLSQLPPKRQIILPMDIDRREEYERAEEDLIKWLSTYDYAAAIRARFDRRTKFTYLKRLAAQLKLPYVYEWVDNFLQNSDDKLLLGVWHRDIIAKLEERYGKGCVVIHGGKTTLQRENAEKAIMTNPKVRILIGQIKSAGLGLNLPNLTVALAEFPWNPGTAQQFIDRAHRLTTTKKINVYWLVAENTIESRMLEIIQAKQKTLDMVLDGKKVRDDSLTVFDLLQNALLAKTLKKEKAR